MSEAPGQFLVGKIARLSGAFFMKGFILILSGLGAARAEPQCHYEHLECQQPVMSSQLLQISAAASPDQLLLSEHSPDFHFEREKMWGFDDPNSSWQVSNTSGPCTLRFPASPDSPNLTKESRLSLDACISILQPLERWRLDLALPATHGRKYPGANPSLVPMPAGLEAAFPSGKWLVVNRNGWGRCPGMEDFNGMSDYALMNNLFGNGSHAAVLDENFRVQAVSSIEVEGDATFDWNYQIVDVRLWVSEQGDIIVTFLPYWFGEMNNHLIAKLHVSVAQQDGTHDGFRVWVNRHEVRRPQSCLHPEEKMKNLGFFQFGGKTFLLDKIYPTAVASMNLSLLSASQEQELSAQHNHTFHHVANRQTRHYLNESFAAICMEPQSHDLKSHHSPWTNVTGQWPHFFIHNGPSPVWIDELQLFLGIGHMARGKRASHQVGYLPDHYTHQFFALDIAQQTFRLAALSPEFCFSSAQDPQDCENIQFASTLVRDGSSLLVGYGAEDCDSFLHRFSLDHVVQFLVNVSDI